MMLHKYGYTKPISVVFSSHCDKVTLLSAIQSRVVWQISTNAPEVEEMSPLRSIKL
jgi:hypothetical protein